MAVYLDYVVVGKVRMFVVSLADCRVNVVIRELMMVGAHEVDNGAYQNFLMLCGYGSKNIGKDHYVDFVDCYNLFLFVGNRAQ